MITEFRCDCHKATGRSFAHARHAQFEFGAGEELRATCARGAIGLQIIHARLTVNHMVHYQTRLDTTFADAIAGAPPPVVDAARTRGAALTWTAAQAVVITRR